jgi:2-oxoglutarate ferredoxin oxidoreductase subunit gamma
MNCRSIRTSDSSQEAVIISGFGGQGIVLAGRLLAHAAMLAGREVTYIPAYGAEVRGGASNCTVVIASQPIASPIISFPDCVIAMSKAAMHKFAPTVKPGGLLLYNNSLIDEDPALNASVTAVGVPADRLALDLGSLKAANMVMVGAYVQWRACLSVDGVIQALPAVLSRRHHDTIPLNTLALRKGAQFARSMAESLAGSVPSE